MTELILVRHAQPHGGAADPGLTPAGQEMAQAAARWLAHDDVDIVVASPLRRAIETAQPIAAAVGRELLLHEGLREWDSVPPRPQYVPLEEHGLEHPRMRALHEGRYESFRPTGYDEAAFLAGAAAALDSIFEQWPVERIVAVAHGGIINALLHAVLRPRGGFFFAHLAYASISIIERVPAGRMVVRSVNDTGHLLGDRRPGTQRPTVLDG